MIFFHQGRLIRIAPRLGVEMQAEHEVRLQLVVHQAGPASDFAVPIKKQLSLPRDRFFLLRVGRAVEVLPGIADPGLLQDPAGGVLKIRRAIRRDRLRLLAQERDFRA